MRLSHAASLCALAGALSSCAASREATPDASGAGEDAASRIDGSPSPDGRPGPDAMPGAYRHTINIDGSNDFSSTTESFATTSSGYTAFVTWDSDYLYLGMQGADISSGSSTHFVLAYLGTGGTGTDTGLLYNTQEPALPFDADYHVRWKADNTFTNTQRWNGSAWEDAGWDFTGDVQQSGEFLELRIPLNDISSPSIVDVHLAMINEAAMIEGTYAGTPGTSFSDGYDPDFATFFRFDLGGMTSPADYAPQS